MVSSHAATARVASSRVPPPGAPPPRDLRPSLGPTRYPLPLPGWDGVGVTARVPPDAVTTLGRLRVGDVADLPLAVLDRVVVPAHVGADRWRTDGQGTLEARGTFERTPTCSAGVLVVAGRRWALVEGIDARPGTRIEVAGALELVVDGGSRVSATAASLALRWRVLRWRRYGAGAADDVATPLRALPGAREADPTARYVVDLDPA